ncbi:zeta toxin family protein [Akkermansia sp.]|uniref:zeta toxin family protein n=1 Tax=Akkermansia sp. TaxID=1872421 RepID=UPI003AAF0AA9
MDSTLQCPIVAGPNGAGKTTFALDYLMHETNCRSFINADMIAQGLSPLKPEAVQVKAGKLFLEELERHLKQRESFCFETTLSGSSYFQKIKQWKKDGWRIVLHYLWIPNAQFSALRVQERVAQGGTWHSSGIHFAPL